ncbi:MAG TPA: hypothetical protein GXX18_00385, partial [Bacillales bacterium]|nr:hypothetical protein [Bacillales bacterium]
NIEDLQKLFIVSHLEIAGDQANAPSEAQSFDTLSVVVKQAEGETCERCWVVSPTVGAVAEHPTLCKDCGTIVQEHYVK